MSAAEGAPVVESATAPAKEDEKAFQYPVQWDEYELYEEIGRGAYARVFRGRVKGRPDKPVAVKLLDLEVFNTSWEEIRQEVNAMRSMQHDNVVEMYCSFVNDHWLWIVMPIMLYGSMSKVLKDLYPKGIKDEELLATILKEVLQGLEYFHKDGRIHRDIKAGNILLGENGEVKIGDFGVAGTLIDTGLKKTRRTFTGTPCWMAPEIMEQTSGYDTKADVWSFGITAMELAFGRAPYAHFQPMKVLLHVLKQEPPKLSLYGEEPFNDESWKGFSSSFDSLLKKCLVKNPKKRAKAAKLLKEHRFFKKAKDKEYIRQKVVEELKKLRPEAKSEAEEKPIDLSGEQLEKIATVPSDRKAAKPITVSTWIFATDDIQKLIAEASAKKEGEAEAPEPSAAAPAAAPEAAPEQ